MELKLYNTLTRKKEVFRPLDRARVRMYVCGPTVYDHAHIGNARPLIVFDVLFRLLRHLYGPEHVTYVRNVTDVDDKINARAAERGIAIRALTEETFRNFKEDVAALGCLEPTHEPRATEYVRPMIVMIEKLIAANHAYPREGHVLFDVTSKSDYGKLSNRSVDDMIAGARVEVAPYKKNPMDFVLWKPSTPELPGWDSPWGRGRPGWHIECSAMGEALLGPTFDIHGGGIDLVFPHHENEIAQSECAHSGAPLAQVWIHNGFLQVEGEKMAKSVGNVVTVRGLLSGWQDIPHTGDAIRLAMIMTHYRQPLDWTLEKLAIAGANLHTFRTIGIKGLALTEETDIRLVREISTGRVSDALLDCLMEDLNTPAAILSHLFSLVKEADAKGGIRKEPAKQLLIDCLFLGLDPFRFGRAELAAWDAHQPIDTERVTDMVAARDAARKTRNYKKADEIRDELEKMGVVLKDSPEGTTWEVAR